MAESQHRENLGELAWLAYMAEQLGWDQLAERIALDAIASQERLDWLDLLNRESDS